MLYYILTLSIIINLVFALIDILPLIVRYTRKSLRRYSNPVKDIDELEKLILIKSLKMAKSSKVLMPTSEHSHFIAESLKLIRYRSRNKYILYNFPKAYLFVGLSDYGIKRNDASLMKKVAIYFEQYIDRDGTPSFNFDKVDQAPFGITAINLFVFYKDEKYKKMADYIFFKLVSWVDDESKLIAYRSNNDQLYLCDTIGMICPFLLRYGSKFKSNEAIMIAKNQIAYFTKYGIDNDSYLPTHAIDRATNIKVGSTNWGRGIGWYFIGLSCYLENADDYAFKDETIKLISTLYKLRIVDGVWSQFPGSSIKFDASPSTMFMYCINSVQPETYSRIEVLNTLRNYLSDGIIGSTSGDTYWVNLYSRTFGDSELSQGFLLMLLSTTK